MKYSNLVRISCLSAFLLLFSCEDKPKLTETDLLFSSIQNDQSKWWNYHNRNIQLSSDFVPLNESGDTVSKKAFLETLVTGDYIALEKRSKSNNDLYQLFRLTDEADKDIKYTMSVESYREYKHYLLEGKELPGFELTDLQGNIYNKEVLEGKTLALKTWFINCKPCIEEMPQLNALVESYEDNDDIVFLSLALDPEEKLAEFLSKKEFKYAVVPNQKAFIEDTLGFSIYPTHVIVAPSGKIVKVVNTAPEMIAALEGTALETTPVNNAPPPPPPPGDSAVDY